MNYIEQTALFLDLLMKHRKYCIDNNLNWSVYPEYFLDNGVTKQTLRLLEESHYIAIHENQPIWLAWKENPIFPTQTIERLNSEISMRLLKIREEQQKKDIDKDKI